MDPMSMLLLAGTATNVAGTIIGSMGSTSLSMANASEQASNYGLSASQAKYSAAVAKSQGTLGAAQIKANAALEAANYKLSAGMQASMFQFNGAIEKMLAEYDADFLDVQSKRARALGQDNMFEVMRQLEISQSELQANAAASGFMATDAGTMDVAEDLEEYGYLQASRAYAVGEAEASDIEYRADVRRLEGGIASEMGELNAKQVMDFANFTANASLKKAAIEAQFFKQNKKMEADARMLEARGYGGLARMSIAMGAIGAKAEQKANQSNLLSGLFAAGGQVASAGYEYSKTGNAGFHAPKSSVTTTSSGSKSGLFSG